MMVLNNKPKQNNSNQYQEKEPIKPKSIMTTFIKLKHILYSKLLHKYSSYYYQKHLSQDDFIGLRMTTLPTYFDLYKTNELVFNKKSHYNILFKEKMLQNYPDEVLIQLYSKREINQKIKTLLLSNQMTYPTNLLPSGSLILKIIKKKQESYWQRVKHQFQWQIILEPELKKEQMVAFKASDNITRGKQLIEKEEFHLSNFSLSVSFEEKSNDKRRTGALINGREMIHKQILNHAFIIKDEVEIDEIEAFINQIESIEQNVSLRALLKSKHKKTNSCNEGDDSYSNLNNKSIKDQLLITNILTICENNNQLKNNDGMGLNSPLMLKPSLRKFKTLDEFIEKGKVIANRKQKHKAIVQNVINCYHQLQNPRARSASITPITAGHSTKLFCYEAPYQRDSYLALKTRKIIKSIEDESKIIRNIRTPTHKLFIGKRIRYPNINNSSIVK